jgi:flagellar biosynthetic protein FliR
MTQTTLLVFARAAGLVSRAPGFAHPSVPVLVRVAFALALAFAVAPTVRPAGAVDLVAFTLAVATEFALGAAIGFGAALLYDGAYFAGRTIDDYLGVRGSLPGAHVTSAQAFGRLWSSVFLAAFVLLDGWVPLIGAFATSFDHVTPGAFVDRAHWLYYAVAMPATILRAAFVVAAPAIAIAAALQLALAAVARVVPRFSSVSLAFPVVFAGGLAITIATAGVVGQLGARPWLIVPWGTP